MILTDKMLSLALDVRDAQPWRFLDDSNIFAVRLSSGEIGYICVMGHAGEHFAIGLYIGVKGFSSYLKSLIVSDQSHADFFEEALAFDYINCDFENVSAIDPKVKKRIKTYAETNGRKIRRPKGWPDFTRHTPYKELFHITGESDAHAITEALQAVLAMTEKLSHTDTVTIGFDYKKKYPTVKGGKLVPLLTPDGKGGFDFGTTALPALPKETHKTVVFDNDILAHAVSSLPEGDSFECKYFHLPRPIYTNPDEASVFPAMILCVNAETGESFPIIPQDEESDNPKYLLAELAQFFTTMEARPTEITVSDKPTQALLKDFCKRCGIKLTLADSLPQLEEPLSMIYAQLMWM